MKYDKLSARMSAFVERHKRPSVRRLPESPRAAPMPGLDAVGGEQLVQAFISCDANASLSNTEGVRPRAMRGTVRTALVSLSGIEKLSERDDVHRISPAIMMKPLNDLCAQRTRLPVFRNNHPEQGRDVVIGIVDSGIDATHPAFRDRIECIWDQTIQGEGWGTTNYGTVLRGQDLSDSRDTHGHGTHVAGIAAGNDENFGGVAPAARLVCVKTDFMHTSVADGIRFIFSEADRLQRPAVINLSLGSHHDPHDGSDDLSRLIAERSGSGRIVVAAAGNEGTNDIHAAAEIGAGQRKEILLRVPHIVDPHTPPWVRLNGWYNGGDCEISIQTPSGDETPFQPVIDGPNPSNTYNLSDAVVRLTTSPASANGNNEYSFLVELEPVPSANRVQTGTWRLRIRNVSEADVRVDVWSIVPTPARDAFFVAPFRSADMKIGTPGAARQAITVASFTSRNKWVDFQGQSQFVNLTLDTISDFSSPGPLRNGFPKPDVTAPGAMIVSCLSRTSMPLHKDVVNDHFRVNSGTSMACPYITGLVALLLERTPTLDATAIKAMLKENSSVPKLDPGAFHPSWGFGLIDAGSL